MVELVIKIDEDTYKDLIQTGENTIKLCELLDLRDSVRDGIPLPKGHGRLIDADALNRRNVNCANVPMNFIDIAPTIVEADKAESEDEK